MRKKYSSDRDKLLKFETEGRESAKFLRSLEQFIQTVKGQKQFLVTECFFNLFLEVCQISKKKNNYNSNLKKILGFRNLQETLEKTFVE